MKDKNTKYSIEDFCKGTVQPASTIYDFTVTDFYKIYSEAQTIWRQEIYNAVRLILLNETKESDS